MESTPSTILTPQPTASTNDATTPVFAVETRLPTTTVASTLVPTATRTVEIPTQLAQKVIVVFSPNIPELRLINAQNQGIQVYVSFLDESGNEFSPEWVVPVNDSCSFAMTRGRGNLIEIGEFHPIDESLETISIVVDLPEQSIVALPKISPDGDWVSYVVWENLLGQRGGEFNDIWLHNLDTGKEFLATNNRQGWELGGVWSENGEIFVFPERNLEGYTELKATYVDAFETRIVGTLSDQGVEITSLSISPDNNLVVARGYDANYDHFYFLLPVNIEGPSHYVTVDSAVAGGPAIWFGSPESFVFETITRNPTTVNYLWIDANTLSEIGRISSPPIVGPLHTPFRLDESGILGVFTGESISIFSIQMDQMIPWLASTELPRDSEPSQVFVLSGSADCH